MRRSIPFAFLFLTLVSCNDEPTAPVQSWAIGEWRSIQPAGQYLYGEGTSDFYLQTDSIYLEVMPSTRSASFSRYARVVRPGMEPSDASCHANLRLQTFKETISATIDEILADNFCEILSPAISFTRYADSLEVNLGVVPVYLRLR